MDQKKSEEIFGGEQKVFEAVQNQTDGFARDFVFCPRCEEKFGLLESIFAQFQQATIPDNQELKPNHPSGVEIRTFSDSYHKNLIAAYCFLNLWRFGLFHFDDKRSEIILEKLRTYLLNVIDIDPEKQTPEDIKSRLLIELELPISFFAGYYNLYDPKDSQPERDLKPTKTITYHSPDFNYFHLGLYTMIYQPYISDYLTDAKQYFGLGEKIKIVDFVSTQREVKIAILPEEFREMVLKNFLDQEFIPAAKGSLRKTARRLYAKYGYALTAVKFERLWNAYGKKISLRQINADQNESLIVSLMHQLERSPR
ncbi:hypothetical protein [Dyadobacter psychrotolerans]|uniref:Uncharacterized protein n=1 Tax=Dyadobacter psychrotolerans TaxID=2541721 RepID=A0A4R5DMN7_9BACT|nr:hypothetical protein [Dyadobacter psychrotolerans]TDE14777.1 hypothetical protein E0F88_16455 [Dyadobacter psychrotolerans]